ncbi:hypothetical protein BUALT_Bualt19G0073400 [Buddleja alternifolia]|uniref:Uncharacterized protein n=1 Tax=Buddleja alternifolia TaxID=168488 RepID=A0AAV6W1R3_9LAMI|nr:hypothetical protein BUALT_Bualt19G0073400 [Buddleja alternifolia]
MLDPNLDAVKWKNIIENSLCKARGGGVSVGEDGISPSPGTQAVGMENSMQIAPSYHLTKEQLQELIDTAIQVAKKIPDPHGPGASPPGERNNEKTPTNMHGNKPLPTIHMISGGPESGRALRRNVRHAENVPAFFLNVSQDLPQEEICFGMEDTSTIQTPHNDALVITTTIANYNVQRVFIGSGSSVDILFYQGF